MQNRYYNPEWGRFINADGIIGETGELLSHNIFAYCNNNFANFNAPSGYLRCALDYEGGGGGGGAIAIPLVSGGLKDCLKGLGYGAIGTIKAIGAALSGKAYLLGRSKIKSKEQTIGARTHGNSKRSKKHQHGYEIYNIVNGDVVKCGISGGKIRRDGKSYRAEKQVRRFNRDPFDGNIYASRIVAYLPDRESALLWEETYSQLLWDAGNSMSKHKRPRPWK